MTDVFISYSRRDKVFTQKLVDALQAASREVWADWASIPAASDWDAEIKEGIEKTNTVLFVLSPEWIKSNECRKEMDHAVKMGKRLVPILHIMPAEGQQVPPELAKLNWVYMREGDDFDKAFQLLLGAMDTDLDWIKTHTRIQVRALEWEKKNRSASFALRGEDLTEGEQFIASGANKSPAPTQLQSEYILASRKDATRRQRQTLAGVTVALVVSIILAVVAAIQWQEAVKQTQISHVGELAAQSVALRQKNYLVSLLLGAKAYRGNDDLLASVQVKSTLLDNAQFNPKLEQFLNGHSVSVSSVAFSPDGKNLASGGWDNTIILWNMENRQPSVPPLNGHSDAISSLAFSPDGKTLASGSWDKTIILWDTVNHEPVAQLSGGHSGAITSIALSPDGKILASGSIDATIVLWDVVTKKPTTPQLIGHKECITSLVFSPDGKILASGSWDNTIILWDVEKGTPIDQPLSAQTKGVTSLAFSPDGKTLAAGSGDGTIIQWNITSQPPILGQPLTGHTAGVKGLAFSPDGYTLASGSDDSTIRLWDVGTGKLIDQPLTGHTEGVTSIAFSPDGKTIASGSRDSVVILWDVTIYASILGQPLTDDYLGRVKSLAFSPDSKTLASGSDDDKVILWDMTSHPPILGQALTGHTEDVTSVVFSPDGKTIASGSDDDTVILWDMTSHPPIPGQVLTGHTEDVTSVAFSPDGKTLASGSRNGTVVLWDLTSRPPIPTTLKGHALSVTSVAFSPDGITLASSSEDSTIRLWNLATNQSVSLIGHTQRVSSVAFSPDGKTLASSSEDSTIRLWNLAVNQSVSLIGHTQRVASVAFSPDGKTLASGSCEKLDPEFLTNCIKGEIILWDVTTHKVIGQLLTTQLDYITSLAFNPDGKTLASGSDDATIMIWDIDPKSWGAKFCPRANRDFIAIELERYFFGEDYQTTCPQFAATPTESSIDNPTLPAIAQVTPPPTWIAQALLPGVRPASYTVQSGEDLLCIARRFNVNPAETVIINGFSNTQAAFAGLTLRIPQTGSPFPASRMLRNHPSTYIVSSAHETLNSIACQFGDVDPSVIAIVNGMDVDSALIVGQQINIP